MRWPWQRNQPPEKMDLSPFLGDTERVQTAEEAARLIFPPDAFLNGCVRAVATVLEMPVALVNFVYGDSTDPLASVGIDMATYSFRATDAICTYVAASGHSMIFDSPETAPLVKACIQSQNMTLSFYAAEPLRYRGRVVGVIGVADDSGRPQSHRRVLAVLRDYARRIEAELQSREDREISGVGARR